MASHLTDEDFNLQKPLEHFRAKTKRLKIHHLEVLLLWVVAAHLVFLPWALGGMRLWGQLISLALAALSFGISLVPRHYTEAHTGAGAFRLVPWPRLVRFPIFWIGLVLLVYITAQGLNPAWVYVLSYNGWWMQQIAHVEWLPSGVDVPFERGGPWRMLIIYASAWLTMCAIWVGFTRRRSLQALFITISANGLALAAFGLAQRMLSNEKMFWTWIPPSGSFFSSFVYKNHAGAYLNLTLAVTCGLAAWYYLRGLRRLEKSNPAGLFAFFATCIGVSILVSYARGATFVMLIFLCVCVAVFLIHQFLVPNNTRKPIVAIALLVIFGGFLKTGLTALNSHEAWTRLSRSGSTDDSSLAFRREATSASIDMLKDNWPRGTGAGSFRFLFPAYQQYYPKIFTLNGLPNSPRYYWEHAHNDLVEIGLELGPLGLALVLGAGIYISTLLIRKCFWENPLSGCVIFGNALLVFYGWWDFPFQCPAVLILWCSLFVATIIWTSLEEMNLKG